MTRQARRNFLKQSTLGVASAGMLAVAGLQTACASEPEIAMSQPSNTTVLSAEEMKGPIVAYVRDLNRGEISLLVGNREIIYSDPEFTARLTRAMP